MGTTGAPRWPLGFEHPVEDRHLLAAAARRWFNPTATRDVAPASHDVGGAGTEPSATEFPDGFSPAVPQSADRLPDLVADQLAQITQLLAGVADTAEEGAGPTLTSREFAALHLLQSTGPLRPIDLGGMLRMDKSMTSRLVRTLSERGLLARDSHPTDRRAFLVGVTDAGRTAVDQTADARAKPVSEVLSSWDDPSVSALLMALSRLRDGWSRRASVAD